VLRGPEGVLLTDVGARVADDGRAVQFNEEVGQFQGLFVAQVVVVRDEGAPAVDDGGAAQPPFAVPLAEVGLTDEPVEFVAGVRGVGVGLARGGPVRLGLTAGGLAVVGGLGCGRVEPAGGAVVKACRATVAAMMTSQSSSATSARVWVVPLRGFWPVIPMYAADASPASSTTFISRITASCSPMPLAVFRAVTMRAVTGHRTALMEVPSRGGQLRWSLWVRAKIPRVWVVVCSCVIGPV
jgi:hypothetical protein